MHSSIDCTCEIAHDEGDRVGAGAEIGGMAERQQAGVAEQQIEAERGDGKDQPVGQQLGLVEIDEPAAAAPSATTMGTADSEQQRDARGRCAREPGMAQALPNRPVGRMSRTAVAIR